VLIDPLVAKGALQSDGQPDQARIDAAFRAAISGGRMMLVRKIWEFGAVEHRPALTFDDVADDGTRKRSPVTLLLVHHSWKSVPWEGMEDTLDDRSILIKYDWSALHSSSPHFEQSFSNDGGKSWEVNWITDQSRVK
jgi:hypothetical protein